MRDPVKVQIVTNAPELVPIEVVAAMMGSEAPPASAR